MPAGLKNNIQGLILDMDGVLWRSTEPIGDLPAIFETIQNRGWQVVLASNNATLSITQYQEKLRSFGLDLEPRQIINSAMATAQFLQHKFPHGSSVYVVGEQGLQDTLLAQGFNIRSEGVDAVVVALDRSFSYERLRTAASLIREGALFVATNPDRTFPSAEGIVPGAGSLVAAVEAASEIQPIMIGKPQPEMFRQALERMGTKPPNTLVVGDRLETDIAGGQGLGCLTGLVLSGVTTLSRAHDWKPPPDFVAPDLTHLLQEIR